MNLQSYPLGTLIAIASKEMKKLSEQFLIESLDLTGNHRFQNVAFISTEIKQEIFYKISLSNQEQLVYVDVEKPTNGNCSNGNICLPKNSMLFLDLPDKSLHRNDDGILDIEHIHKIIVSLKNKYNAETIIIDNIDEVECFLMGRNELWKTNISNTINYEDWKERRHEYLISLLFYMSRKFNVRIVFGKQIKKGTTLPIKISDINYLSFGNSYDMIDEIMYWDESEDLKKLKNNTNS